MDDAYGPIYDASAYASYGQYLESHGEQMTYYARALGLIDRFKAQMTDLFEDYDLLLSPALALPPLPVREFPNEIAGRPVYPHRYFSFHPFTYGDPCERDVPRHEARYTRDETGRRWLRSQHFVDQWTHRKPNLYRLSRRERRRATLYQGGGHPVRQRQLAGYAMTPLTREMFSVPNQLGVRIARVPMGRAASAVEVANAILYLASDESSFVTGSEVVVDGGVTTQ